MIKLSTFKIKYNENIIIENGEFELVAGDYCALTGTSGSGKTTLLEVLSLNYKCEFTGDYLLNKENVMNLTEEEISYIKRSTISYVPQNGQTFSNFTVIDNLRIYSEIGCSDSNDMIDYLLDVLKLNSLKDIKVKKLSGGEKQRVAIACAIAKNADLYLFDEPTAMLDIENKSIVNTLLKNLALSGKTVLVVTHEKECFDFNKEYEIENNNIKMITNMNNEKEISDKCVNKTKVEINKDLVKKIAQLRYFSSPIINVLFVIVAALCISLVVTIYGTSATNVIEQYKVVDVVNSPELFVVNNQGMGFINKDDEVYPKMPVEIIQTIADLPYVKSVNDFIYFPLTSYNFDFEKNKVINQDIRKIANITLLEGNGIKNIFNYYDSFMIDSNDKTYAIFPTFEHQKISEQCSKINNQIGKGIYISPRVAEALNITDVKNVYLNLTFSVPIGNDPTIVIEEKNGTEYTYYCNLFLNVLVNETFPIKGILQTDVKHYVYQGNFQADFFLDSDVIYDIQNRYYNNYKSKLIEISKEPMTNNYLKTYYTNRLTSADIWGASAVVVNVDSNDSLEIVAKEIMKLDPGVSVVITDYGIANINTNYIAYVILNAIMYSGIIILILFVGLIILKRFKNKSYYQDEKLLLTHGFSTNHLLKIRKKEVSIEVKLIILIAFIMYIFQSSLFKQFKEYNNIIYYLLGLILIILLSYAILLSSNKIALINNTKQKKVKKQF